MNAGSGLEGVSVLPAMNERQKVSEIPTTNNQLNGRSPKAPIRSGQRFEMLNNFVDVTMRGLTPRQRAVWMCLYRDSRDGIAKTAQTYIAERCGLQRPTVSTTIGELEDLGLVETIHRGGLNRGISNYRVHAMIPGD